MDPPFEPGTTRGVGPLGAFIVLTSTPVEVKRGRIGPAGENRTCTLLRRTRQIPLAPGTYKIAMPYFDLVKSRFTIELRPGEQLQVHFRAKSPQVVELLRADREPIPASAAP